MIDLYFIILGLVLLLGLDLLAIATRSAFLLSTHGRLLGLHDKREKKVSQAIKVLGAVTRRRAALNLILVLTRVLLAGLVVYLVIRRPLPEPFWTATAALLTSALVLYGIESAVERRVALDPDRWALRLSFPAWMLMRLLELPFSGADESANGTDAGSVTAIELKSLVDAGQKEGLFKQDEGRMISSIIDLRGTLAREIMAPRIDMQALDVDTPLTEAADAMIESGHSRVPVYEGTVDNTLGMLYVKDLLRVWREDSQIDSLRPLLRPGYFVPEAKKVGELLKEMRLERVHMAIVVDEYGGVAGLVTMEDIVEEILGEIRDEYDQGEESPYQALKNGDYIFQARVDLDDFNEIMNSDLQKDENDTIGGYIYNRLGRVPVEGDVVQIENLRLTVEEVLARRIRKVRASWIEPADTTPKLPSETDQPQPDRAVDGNQTEPTPQEKDNRDHADRREPQEAD